MTVSITDDFDLQAIADSGQCFRWDPIPGGMRILHGKECLLVRPVGKNRYDFSCTEDAFERIWAPYLDLAADYAAIRARIDPEKDPFLAAACAHQAGIRILRQDPWEMLISFIISQNRNIPAIRNSIAKLCEAAGEQRRDEEGNTYFTFPAPEAVAALSGEAMDRCRLGYRDRYVRSAAEKAADGSIDFTALSGASDEELLKQLLAIYGVGVKVASCVMLFGFHRVNAFPVDVWIRRVLEEHYPRGYPREEYAPYNGIYQQYLFAEIRSGRK